MKIDKHINEFDKVEIINQSEKKYRLQKVAQIIPHKGHTTFEINAKTGEVKTVEYKEIKANVSLKTKTVEPLITKTIEVKKDCMYISALNEKNAIKKFNKQIIQLSKWNKNNAG